MMEALLEPIPLECPEVLARLWDYLDGSLTPETTEALRSHLARCPQCSGYQHFQKSISQALTSLQVRDAIPPRTRKRVLDALADAGFEATERPWSTRGSKPSSALAGRILHST
jgi:anti-sigma factor (TIGR02949 family)